jgi:Ca2+-transporting ATPase
VTHELPDAYRLSADEVLTALGADLHRGLTDEEAAARLSTYGHNEVAAEAAIPAWRRFLAQFKDVLVILLLVATAISVVLWVYERDTALPYESIAIFAIVLLNAAMGFVQESRAEAAVTALRAMSASEAQVIRSGERRGVPAADLVPGDVVLVEQGDTIPADARVVTATALQTAEAALTGESLPVSKDPAPISANASLGDRDNMVFSGTTATYGRGTAVVTATGMRTEMGHIAGLLREAPAEVTPLQRELDRTGKLLGLVVVIIAVIMIVTIILVEGVRGFAGIVDVLILGVALAVAAVPEGLPTIVTAVLSIGVQRMARRNAIVRHLAAVGERHRIGQDRNTHPERNDSARRGHRERPRVVQRIRLRA